MAQTVDGWAFLQQQVRRFTRTVNNDGAVTDDLIAACLTEGQQMVFDLVLESDVEWALKNAVVDDTASSFGTEVSLNRHRYFIETDLGITDLARVRKIWRRDPNNEKKDVPLYNLSRVGDFGHAQDFGLGYVLSNTESWAQDGDIEPTSGNHEIAIHIFNRYASMTDGHLLVNYWFYPPLVEVSDFYEVDASGNLTNRPVLPRATWPAIMNYAQLVILETVEDQYKNHSLWRRFNGKDGILDRVRQSLARFQTGEPEYGADTFSGEGY